MTRDELQTHLAIMRLIAAHLEVMPANVVAELSKRVGVNSVVVRAVLVEYAALLRETVTKNGG